MAGRAMRSRSGLNCDELIGREGTRRRDTQGQTSAGGGRLCVMPTGDAPYPLHECGQLCRVCFLSVFKHGLSTTAVACEVDIAGGCFS